MKKAIIQFEDGCRLPQAEVEQIVSSIDEFIQYAADNHPQQKFAEIFFADIFDLQRPNSAWVTAELIRRDLAVEGKRDFQVLPDVRKVARTYYTLGGAEFKIQKLPYPCVTLVAKPAGFEAAP